MASSIVFNRLVNVKIRSTLVRVKAADLGKAVVVQEIFRGEEICLRYWFLGVPSFPVVEDVVRGLLLEHVRIEDLFVRVILGDFAGLNLSVAWLVSFVLDGVARLVGLVGRRDLLLR